MLSLQILNELSDGHKEERLLLTSECIEVLAKTGQPCVCRQRRLRLLSFRWPRPLAQRADQLRTGSEGADSPGGPVGIGLMLASLPVLRPEPRLRGIN